MFWSFRAESHKRARCRVEKDEREHEKPEPGAGLRDEQGDGKEDAARQHQDTAPPCIRKDAENRLEYPAED
jgi:hypothetical protein